MAQILGTVRASSWKTLFSCQLSWYFSNVLKLRLASASIAMIGTAVHAGTAIFDAPRLRGDEVSVDEAVEAALAILYDDDVEVSWDSASQMRAAESVVVRLVTKYCLEVAPNVTYSAVEVRCEDLHINTEHGVIVTTGTIDRVRLRGYSMDDAGDLMELTGPVERMIAGEDCSIVTKENVRDLKTGMQAVVWSDGGERVATIGAHHMQVGIYTFMTEQQLNRSLDAPAEITGMSTAKDGDIVTTDIRDVRTALLGTEKFPGMIDLAAKTLKSGLFAPNPSSPMCSPKYCPGYECHCPYRA